MQAAFQINIRDNVATALEDLRPGPVRILGDTARGEALCTEAIPKGHKMALKDMGVEEDVMKYGVRIGRTGKTVRAGQWVHLHNMHSVYDERSGHLDIHTGAPTDISYE